MSADLLLSLASVTRAYRAGSPGCSAANEVLRGVSVNVASGDLVTIQGAPGSGKTTLLLCAAGLLRPDSGAVTWPRFNLRGHSVPREVRYVSDRASTYGFLTVRESLAYAATLCEIEEPRAAPPRFDPMEAAGLESLAGTRVALLSRAERARFLIALALVRAPLLMLVDDLLQNDDRDAQAGCRACLMGLAERGLGIVWAARPPGASGGSANYELIQGRLRHRDDGSPAAIPLPAPPPSVAGERVRGGFARVAEP